MQHMMNQQQGGGGPQQMNPNQQQQQVNLMQQQGGPGGPGTGQPHRMPNMQNAAMMLQSLPPNMSPGVSTQGGMVSDQEQSRKKSNLGPNRVI